MPLTVEWKLVTLGMEKRLSIKENLFEIQFSGYKLFPINQVIDVKRHNDSEQIGNAKIIELLWKEDKTYCKYKLLSLQNVN